MSTTNLQPTPLGAVFGMPPDATIYLLHARVKKVFGRKTGKYKQGARTGETWSLQNVELQSGEAEMTMVLKDRDEELSKSWEGRQIRVEAWKGDKGWSGVYAFDDDYQGKITRKIKVTPTGNLSLLDGDGNPEQEREPEPPAKPREQTRQQQQPPAAPQQKPPATPPADRPPERTPEQITAANMREAKRTAYQMANLQLLALNMTEQYTAPRFKDVTGRGLDAQEKHAWAMNLSIELCRQGMLSRMPIHPIKDKPPEPPTDTQPSDNDGY